MPLGKSFPGPEGGRTGELGEDVCWASFRLDSICDFAYLLKFLTPKPAPVALCGHSTLCL